MTEARVSAGVGNTLSSSPPPRQTMVSSSPLIKSELGVSTTLSQRLLDKKRVNSNKGGIKLSTDISEKDAFKGLRENIKSQYQPESIFSNDILATPSKVSGL